MYLYLIGFLQHDAAAMEREAATMMGKPGVEDVVLFFEASSAAHAGQLAKAREFVRRATDSAQRADEKETAAYYQAAEALWEALLGHSALEKDQAAAAVQISNGRDVESLATVALAMADSSGQAARLADDLAKRFPVDTLVQFNYLPTVRAAEALRAGNAAKAIEALEPATPYELGIPNPAFTYCLYTVFLRGQAYLATKQGPAAAAEFQKILDHPGVVLTEPIGALAHLGLGRAYQLSGDTAKSRSAYQDFFALWNDADADIPILKQAKEEYAKLQ